MSTFQLRKTSFVVCLLLLIFGCIFGLRALISKYIMQNDTDSEPIGFYLVTEPDKIQVGKLYAVSIPDDYFIIAKKLGYHADGLFLKKIVASEGDIVRIGSSGVYINNELLPNSQAQESARNIALKPIEWGYYHVLESGEYWTYGEGKTSYDSRYYGIIKHDEVIYSAKYLFNSNLITTWQNLTQRFWR